jgi:myo-inositol-1(or 4)-monophosphatase
MDLERAKRVGLAAAYQSAEILRSQLGKISQIAKKGAIDLVTEADLESERQIIGTIKANFPDHTILAEESGLNEGVGSYQWLVDPLDGTTNFAHQVPIFAISIALAHENNILIGIVLNPVSGELFSAVFGQGAQLNGRRIQVSAANRILESLLVTGFPYNNGELFNPIIQRFANCIHAAQGIRRLGSAALDLCFLACGRFDGYWEQNLKPWDTAAGSLIASEAGAKITDFSNQDFTVNSKEILATNGHIHAEMLELLKIKDAE